MQGMKDPWHHPMRDHGGFMPFHVLRKDNPRTSERLIVRQPSTFLGRAYWAGMMAPHRVLFLAVGSGLHGLYPKPQFSIAKGLSGGKLERSQTEAIDDRLKTHSQKRKWLLRQSEDGWYRELYGSRGRGNPGT